MTSFSSTAHASTSTLRPPSDLRTCSPHNLPSTQIWSPQCNLCNMYSYVTLTKNQKFSTLGQRQQSTSRQKLPVDVNSVLGHTIENSLLAGFRQLVVKFLWFSHTQFHAVWLQITQKFQLLLVESNISIQFTVLGQCTNMHKCYMSVWLGL